jgi:hypothetical protein
MQGTRRRTRTQAERNELLSLPRTVADFEERIDAVASDLGGEEFRGLFGAPGLCLAAID